MCGKATKAGAKRSSGQPRGAAENPLTMIWATRRQVAHSSVPMPASMRSGLCLVHRGFIAMSGRSLRSAQISDGLVFDRALNPLRGFVLGTRMSPTFERKPAMAG